MTAKPQTTSIHKYALSKCLTNEEITNLKNKGEEIVLMKDEKIFSQGEECYHWYYLMDGIVKITHESGFGKEVIKSIVHGEHIINELELGKSTLHHDSAIIISNSAKFLKLESALLFDLVRTNSTFALCLVDFLTCRLKMSEKRLESLALSDARERIVGFLKDNAEKFGTPVGFEMLLKHNFTQQDIANYTGTSRQTVTTVLNDLKKNNKINFRRKSILIRDLKTLI